MGVFALSKKKKKGFCNVSKQILNQKGHFKRNEVVDRGSYKKGFLNFDCFGFVARMIS
ncbi:hypothetical protein HpBGD107_02880 [Helicobacter pylori]|uniref:hypothetical protein n=1 Tax=Helicobacter pylori TaxID=210 RepID=UPI00308DD8EE|nr:hypothetical protein KVC94_00140 [Helicobacter pylori]